MFTTCAMIAAVGDGRHASFRWCFFLIFVVATSTAFTVERRSYLSPPARARCVAPPPAVVDDDDDDNDEFPQTGGRSGVATAAAAETRRKWMRAVASRTVVGSLAAASSASTVPAAVAYVYVDPDRYGDKELKVATVNRLRQQVRDAIREDPQLAPLFLRLAIQDALTFDEASGTGGPDGSIINFVLSSGAPSSVSHLRPAAEALKGISRRIQGTTAVTSADLVAFAGAESIEAAGGPRIAVQLGKMDPSPTRGAGAADADAYPDLSGGPGMGRAVVSAFRRSGLTERELALLIGALCGMERVLASLAPVEEEEEEEENEMGDKDVFVPSSFGAPSLIYGKPLGVLDNSEFASIVDDLKRKKRPINDVFEDEKVGGWALKYASSRKQFLNDLPEAYKRLTNLGTKYTGGKVGSLLGGSDLDSV